jgi:predicted nucleic acid-binding protein
MSDERYSLDTNVLIYAVDRSEGARHDLAVEIVDRSVERDCVLTIQALAEFTAAVARRGVVPKSEAAAQVRDWLQLFPTVAADAGALDRALDAVEESQFAFWDALLLATAARAGCSLVLSEDMHDGAVFDGLRVRDPLGTDALPADLRPLLGMT